MNYLDALVGKRILVDGVEQPQRGELELRGEGVTLTTEDVPGAPGEPGRLIVLIAGSLPPGGTEGQFVTVDGDGEIVWATVAPGAADAESIRTIPVDGSVAAAGLAEDNYVLTYSHGTGFVLAAGGSGGGYATFENDGSPVTQRTVINLAEGLLAVDFGGQTVLAVVDLDDSHIAADAAIAVSKLAAGTAGTVLGHDGYTADPSVTTLSASTAVRSPLYQRAGVGDAVGGNTEFFGTDNNSAASRAGNVSVRGGLNAGAGPDGAYIIGVRRQPMVWQNAETLDFVASMDEDGNLHMHGPKSGPHYAFNGSARVEVTSDYGTAVELARFNLDVSRDHILTVSAHFHSDLGEWKRERTWIVTPGSPADIVEKAERDLLTEDDFIAGITAGAPVIYEDEDADAIVIESPYIAAGSGAGGNKLIHSVQWSLHFTALGDGEDRFDWSPA